MSNFPFAMRGDLEVEGLPVIRGGFMSPNIPRTGFPGAGLVPASEAPADATLNRRDITGAPAVSEDLQRKLDQIKRGEFAGDMNAVGAILAEHAIAMMEVNRGIVSTQTAFPVRQNLEAPAVILQPVDTPMRNRIPREAGAGVAVAWKQATSLGGGWGSGYDQPGGGSVIRMFYAETGAPVEHTTVYADKSASYKLLGTLGSVTNFAAAAGANFADQVETERQNQLTNLMLNEELALLYGDSTSTAAPWGDGSNALAFDGLAKLVTVANGTPSGQVQSSVGALTLAHFDAQLQRLFNQGGDGLWVLMNSQESLSLMHLLQAANSVYRLQITDAGNATMGFHVAKYIHPVTGRPVDLIVDRFQIAGEIVFGCDRTDKGTPTLVVSVLPQVPVPQQVESPRMIQGYVVTMLAHSLTQPDINPFMISCYEVLQMRSALHFARSTGITAV